MNYELQELESLISVALEPQNFCNQENKLAFIKKYEQRINAEFTDIKTKFRNEILNCGNELQLSNYVQYHQYAVIQILNNLWEFKLLSQHKKYGNVRLIKSFSTSINKIIHHINEILEFIRRNAIKYFESELEIPKNWKQIAREEIEDFITGVNIRCKKAEIDSGLKAALLKPFIDFLAPDSKTTFHDLNYFRLFKDNFTVLLAEGEICNDKISEFLLQNNFNHSSFYTYYLEKIKRESSHGEFTGLNYLYAQLKRINQVEKKQDTRYKLHHPSIQDLIATWLAEEIYFLEKKENIHAVCEPATPAGNINKVHTKLSVAQLSLAVRLLLDTGVIKNKNASELMRMVAHNFRTEKSEQISEDSLRNKAYNIEHSSIDGIKNVIIQFLNTIRTYQ